MFIHRSKTEENSYVDKFSAIHFRMSRLSLLPVDNPIGPAEIKIAKTVEAFNTAYPNAASQEAVAEGQAEIPTERTQPEVPAVHQPATASPAAASNNSITFASQVKNRVAEGTMEI